MNNNSKTRFKRRRNLVLFTGVTLTLRMTAMSDDAYDELRNPIADVTNRSVRVRRMAAEELLCMLNGSSPYTAPADKIVSSLLVAAADTNADVRYEAVKSLTFSQSLTVPTWRMACEIALRDMTNAAEILRVKATMSLRDLTWRMTDPGRDIPATKIVTALTNAMMDTCASVRSAAAGTLIRYDYGALTTCFTNADPVIREAALEWVRSMRDVSSSKEAFAATEDPDPTVRRKAVFTLLDQKTDSANSRLIQMLLDSDQSVRDNAASELIFLARGNRRVKLDDVEIVLAKGNVAAQAIAIRLLGRCDPPPVDRLITTALDTNKSESIRTQATQALIAQAADVRVLRFVRDMFEDKCLLALATHPANANSIDHPWPFIGNRVTIGGPGSGAVPYLILHGDSSDAQRIVNAANAGEIDAWNCGLLGQMGENALPAIGNALKSSNNIVCEAAISCLVNMPKTWKTCASLRVPLTNGVPSLRAKAALCLGCLRDKDSIPALVKLLTDSDEEARGSAATALVMLGDDRGRAIAFAWNKKKFVAQYPMFYDESSGHFLLKYAAPIGSTRAKVAEYFPADSVDWRQTSDWSYLTALSSLISLSFSNDVLVGVFPPMPHNEMGFP